MNSKKGKKPVGTAKKPKPEALMGDLFAAAFKRHKCAAAATIAAVLVLAVIAAWLCGRSGIAEGEAVFYFFNVGQGDAAAVVTSEGCILIDAGTNDAEDELCRQMRRAGIRRIDLAVLTHPHEDHIGGIPYLLKKFNIPIYSTRLTIGLIKGKLKEHGLLNKAKLHEINPSDIVKLGKFSVEFIHVNHSIPDAVGLAITSPVGVIIHTGDFKIDTTPVDGDMINIPRFAEYGTKGVLALFQDSTNAERPGYTMSEKKVGESFLNLFTKAGKRRIVVATFASNIHRVQQIIDVAKHLRRKVAVVGRSLENLVQVGEELGYLNVPDNILISIDNIKDYPDDKLVIITTGSQGEPMSALTKIANGEHRKVTASPNDYVIISATPIPGNEKMVSNVVNELMKRDIEVIYENMYEVHVSGHACQEELKLMMGVIKPKFFFPVHGEQKHLKKHAKLAEAMGISKKNIFIGDIGKHVEITEKGIKTLDNIPSGDVYVDGIGVGDVGNIVLNDRKHLSADGIIIIVATIDSQTGEVLSGPDIVSRGFGARTRELFQDRTL